jgi:hypothetical protein
MPKLVHGWCNSAPLRITVSACGLNAFADINADFAFFLAAAFFRRAGGLF